MKSPAYSAIYIEDAMEILAQMFDFIVYGCRESLKKYMEIFTMTDIASQFESGHPRYVAGMSGIELAFEVMDEVGDPIGIVEYTPCIERSPEYWCGGALAYYQWYSGKSFKEIIQRIPVDEMTALYSPLHEADIEKFVEVMEQRIKETDISVNNNRWDENS